MDAVSIELVDPCDASPEYVTCSDKSRSCNTGRMRLVNNCIFNVSILLQECLLIANIDETSLISSERVVPGFGVICVLLCCDAAIIAPRRPRHGYAARRGKNRSISRSLGFLALQYSHTDDLACKYTRPERGRHHHDGRLGRMVLAHADDKGRYLEYLEYILPNARSHHRPTLRMHLSEYPP